MVLVEVRPSSRHSWRHRYATRRSLPLPHVALTHYHLRCHTNGHLRGDHRVHAHFPDVFSSYTSAFENHYQPITDISLTIILASQAPIISQNFCRKPLRRADTSLFLTSSFQVAGNDVRDDRNDNHFAAGKETHWRTTRTTLPRAHHHITCV